MIAARKNKWFNAWFAGHAERRIQRSFGQIWVHGLDEARQAAQKAPLLVISNHLCWWDPLVALMVSHSWLGCDGHALMDAKNLRRLPFFSLIGAFGVDREKPGDGAAVIQYGARLLERAGTLVWVFPQGKERPAHIRPLGFKAGSAEMARLAPGALVLPLGLHYAHCGEEKPYLYVSFGEAFKAGQDVKEGLKLQEEAVTQELLRIEGALLQASEGHLDASFQCWYRAPASRLGVWAERMLAAMTRPFSGVRAGPAWIKPPLPPR